MRSFRNEKMREQIAPASGYLGFTGKDSNPRGLPLEFPGTNKEIRRVKRSLQLSNLRLPVDYHLRRQRKPQIDHPSPEMG